MSKFLSMMPGHQAQRSFFDRVNWDPITGAVLIAGATASAAPVLTVGGALSAVSALAGIASAFGTIAQGNAQRATYDNQAQQVTQQAGEARASSQRAAENQRRTGAYAESRAQAVTAASGANPDSVTAISNQENLSGQTEYGALTALFNGEEKARGLDYEATSDYQKGSAAHQAGVIGAAGSLAGTAGKFVTASSGSTLVDKYADSSDEFYDNLQPWQ